MAEDEFSGGAPSTAGLATDAALTAHSSDTTGVHGVADTAALATTTQVTDPVVDHTWPEGVGPVLTSPDGTEYRLAVANDGTLSTVDIAVLVSDTFTRANETPLSSPETGPAYTAFSGTGLSVITNQCGKVTGGTQGSVVDAGIADSVTRYTQAVEAASSTLDRLLLRVTDANNHLHLRMLNGQFHQVAGGVDTLVGTLGGGQVVAGEVIEVTLDGADVTATRDGVEDMTGTTALLTGTKYGFQMADAATRVDAFSVATL